MNKEMKEIKKTLDDYLLKFNFSERLENDPVWFPHKFKNREDIEAVSFIAACFAYGKVSQFFKVIEAILERLGPGPYEALKKFDSTKREEEFAGVEYRFNKSRDILIFLEAVGLALRRHGSLSNILIAEYSATDINVMPAVSALVKMILGYAEAVSYDKFSKALPAGVKQLLPDPDKNSTCKRLCMWLRWIVRGPDKIDLGLVKEIPASKLVIPLDTHIFRISNMLGLTKRTDQSLKTAEDITSKLRELDPSDPLKYDFAICHIGISGFCKKGEEGRNCKSCVLNNICVKDNIL
ncbi:MAG TPA: TIGR02757 family protein [Candidatus Wallbacteria bacterium]|nr:TIGR02757 family protein [Candidatus Wallbacteria bacterium]